MPTDTIIKLSSIQTQSQVVFEHTQNQVNSDSCVETKSTPILHTETKSISTTNTSSKSIFDVNTETMSISALVILRAIHMGIYCVIQQRYVPHKIENS